MSSTRPATVTPVAEPEADASAAPGRTGFTERELVVGTALVMVAAHVALRVWMLWPSWFYGDDYTLLGDAGTGGASPDRLVEPHAGQFMPLGRLVAWVVADAGPLSWQAAALSLVAMVVLADLALVWMLLELFGPRWGILLPLVAVLTSAVVVPATMWWAAALNQLPLQVVVTASVAAWSRYLRTRRQRWWVVAVALVGVGLLAYVKTLLVPLVLVWLALAHHATGSPWARVRHVVRRHAAPLAVLAVGGVTFLVWYLAAVPSIVTTGRGDDVTLDLAGTMLGQALPVGLLGGPWRWDDFLVPAALAEPPAWTVVVSWVVLVAVAAGLARRRRRTGRVWALLGLYATAAYLLLLATRAPLVGGFLGFEYRYLTDVAPVAGLCLGLATMSVRGAVEPTEDRAPTDRAPGRARAALPPRARRPVAVGAVALLALSGTWSSVTYARIWHGDDAPRDYVAQVRSDLGAAGTVDLPDEPAPEGVVAGLFYPRNQLSRLLPQAGLDVRFPAVTTRLGHLDETGHLTQAYVAPLVSGRPGPVEGCGYRVSGGEPVTIPLERDVSGGTYWMRLGLLSSAADEVDVSAGTTTGTAQVASGLGSLYVALTGGADSVTVSTGTGTTLCVDDVTAGPLEQGSPW